MGLVGTLEDLVLQNKMESDGLGTTIACSTRVRKLMGYVFIQLPDATSTNLVQGSMAAKDHGEAMAVVRNGN